MELKTALHPVHVAMGARMVPFGGWDMPVQYGGILSEVRAVRTAVGMFDVSHMGRVYISGLFAAPFLDWVLTGSASDLRRGGPGIASSATRRAESSTTPSFTAWTRTGSC